MTELLRKDDFAFCDLSLAPYESYGIAFRIFLPTSKCADCGCIYDVVLSFGRESVWELENTLPCKIHKGMPEPKCAIVGDPVNL